MSKTMMDLDVTFLWQWNLELLFCSWIHVRFSGMCYWACENHWQHCNTDKLGNAIS